MNFPPPSERQARIIWLALTGLALATLVGLCVILIWGLGRVLGILSPVLWPLAVAGVLAYLLDPIVDWLEIRRVPRKRGIVLVFGLAMVVVALLFGSVVPQIVNETRQLAVRVPDYARKMQARIEYFMNHPPEWARRFLGPEQHRTHSATGAEPLITTDETISPTNAAPQAVQPEGTAFEPPLDKQTIQTATSWVAQWLPRFGSWLVGQVGRVASWFGVLAGLALIPIYTFYLLLEKRGIESRWTDYLPLTNSAFKDESVFVLRSINDYLIAFFRGQVLVAICDGVMYTIGFLAINLPYAVLIGVVATFLTMIPYLGAIITCVAALIIAFAQYGDWLHPVLVLGVFAVVQTLEGFVISPKIMGDRVGLHPLTIIIAVMAGTTLLGGILGGILAIPLTAVLRVVFSRYVWLRPVKNAP